jgi:hypothetical protein
MCSEQNIETAGWGIRWGGGAIAVGIGDMTKTAFIFSARIQFYWLTNHVHVAAYVSSHHQA